MNKDIEKALEGLPDLIKVIGSRCVDMTVEEWLERHSDKLSIPTPKRIDR